MSTLTEEISKRRTFAIISHPDAGKTTLTEKLLLFGGAIHIAGAVKSNKIKKTATSDWMEIEKQRGISVATSVMGFNYGDYKINILDTPGHQDFAEDTYRTLTAVDSVIIVVDVAKGVETQTRKLMEVCRMRNTPVIVFVNKLDREGRDPFDILDELEAELKINVRPLSWPINIGQKFKGVYNIYEQNLNLFTPNKQVVTERIELTDVNSPELETYIGEQDAEKLRADLELVEGVYPEFNTEDYLAAKMAPVHRSCIAFVKVCSGKFERNANYKHVRSNKMMRFSSPTAFMAQKKSVVDEAYPGDIVGLPDTGNFKIGDTLTCGEELHFKGLPSFSPEMFKYIENDDPMKSKQLNKGIDQLMDEGVAQLFVSQFNGRKIIGTVGQLQFEVIQYRLLHEYGAQCRWEPISLYKACWIESDDPQALEAFKKRKHQFMSVDRDGRDVFMADSNYVLQMAQTDFPKIKFHFTSEF